MTQKDVIEKNRKSLLVYAQRCRNVTKACETFGVSRSAFYKVKKQLEKYGHVKVRKNSKPRMPNKVRLSTIKILLKLIQEEPAWGCQRYARALKEVGIKVHYTTVQNKLWKLGLSHMWKRYAYVERINKKEGILTEKVLREMQEKKKQHIQADWPGDLVGLDTYYVGNIKGIGKIYQQTGIDCYSRYGFAKVYTHSRSQEVVNFIEEELQPVFWRDGVTLDNILTDNGSEYKNREVKICLLDYNIGHRFTRVSRPESNGICERFHKTIQEEFYRKIFLKKRFLCMDELQEELDKFIAYYNGRRWHSSLDNGDSCPVDYFKPSRIRDVV